MVFCVEDDDSIRELIVYTLRASGYEAEGFPDGASLFAALERKIPRLILLDIMLPGTDGLSILQQLRTDSKTNAVPVILASAKGTEYDKVMGLDLGADDYLAKPFGMMEMLARVRAVLRRSGSDHNSCSQIGRLSMETSRHTVTADGKQVELTLKEYALLQLFMEAPGRVFTRDQLLESVWGNDYYGETRTVDVHIGTLRTKLGSCGEYIRTIRGIGYKLENPK